MRLRLFFVTLSLLLSALYAVAATSAVDGANIPAVSEIVDQNFNKWTLASGKVYQNGGLAGYTSEVSEVLFFNNIIYEKTSANKWWWWNGSAWVSCGNPLVISSSGTAVPSSKQIVDGSLNVWALSGGVVYDNGKAAGYSTGVTELLYDNDIIYQDGPGGWWSWRGTAWAVASNPTSGATPTPTTSNGPPNIYSNATSFYVSVNSGNDSWSGLQSTPNPTHTDGPFKTLAKAQSAMRNSSSIKTTTIRAGRYPTASTFTLTSADNGTTWQYSLVDGPNTAVFSGGGAGGVKVAWMIDGGSNITINGMNITNFGWNGIVVHGGGRDTRNSCTPNAVGAASGNQILNNEISYMQNISDVTEGKTCNGTGIDIEGLVTNTVVANNYVHDNNYRGIDMRNSDVISGTTGNFSGSISKNNVLLHNLVTGSDGAAIYVWNPQAFKSTGWTVTNNFIRDYNSTISTSGYAGHGLYCDFECSNGTWTYNLITGSTNAVAFLTNDGMNNTFQYNIFDLGSTNLATAWLTDPGDTHHQGTPGNKWMNNIIIANSSSLPRVTGTGLTVSGVSYYAQDNGTPAPEPTGPTYAGNLYVQLNANGPKYNTGTSFNTLKSFTDPYGTFTSSSAFGLQCWDYQTVAGSLVTKAPVSFTGLPGKWGPPGFSIPHSGTAPSIPLPSSCVN